MQTKNSDEKNPKPFVKWAGGKKQVLKFIDKQQINVNNIMAIFFIFSYI